MEHHLNYLTEGADIGYVWSRPRYCTCQFREGRGTLDVGDSGLTDPTKQYGGCTTRATSHDEWCPCAESNHSLRPVTSNDNAPEYADGITCVVCVYTMHRAAIVADDYVAFTPSMPVGVLWRDRTAQKIFKKRARLKIWTTYDFSRLGDMEVQR